MLPLVLLLRKSSGCLLIPVLLAARTGPGSRPLWPGASYSFDDRGAAIDHGLAFIYRIASDPVAFAEWGHDLLWCFYTIAATSRDWKLRESARRMGHERALVWRRIHSDVPANADADEFYDLVAGNDAAERLGVRDPAFRRQLLEAAARYSVMDFLLFDPQREPPPADIPKPCSRCKLWNRRGIKICQRCGAPLEMRNRYDLWTDALITTYTGEISGIRLGARYRDVIRWLPAMRPYPPRAGLDTEAFYSVVYSITHVIYTLNDYNRYRIPPNWLPEEFSYLKTNLEQAVRMEDPETLGEFLDTLRDFGMNENAALIRTGVQYLLSKQNADGSWGDARDTDVYDRYHATWTAIDGLRQYHWHGRRLHLRGAELRVPRSAPASAAGR